MKKKILAGILIVFTAASSVIAVSGAENETPSEEQAQDTTESITLLDGEWNDAFFNDEYKNEGMMTVECEPVPANTYESVLSDTAGAGLVIPESWKSVTAGLGYSLPSDNQIEFLVYRTEDIEKLNEMGRAAKDSTASDEYEEAFETAADAAFHACGIYSTDANAEDDGALFSDSDFDTHFAFAEKIGTFTNREYYFVYNEALPEEGFTDEETKQIQNILDSMDTVRENIILFPPLRDDSGETDSNTQGNASTINLSDFETSDLDGNTVTQDIFKDYDVTMVNIWATWCGPCRSELPEIQAAYEKLPENANIISICHDAATDTDLANAIVDKTGLTYPVLVANDALNQSVFPFISAFPTTILVDSSGQFIADSMLIGVPAGSDVAQVYLDYINDGLARQLQ